MNDNYSVFWNPAHLCIHLHRHCLWLIRKTKRFYLEQWQQWPAKRKALRLKSRTSCYCYDKRCPHQDATPPCWPQQELSTHLHKPSLVCIIPLSNTFEPQPLMTKLQEIDLWSSWKSWRPVVEGVWTKSGNSLRRAQLQGGNFGPKWPQSWISDWIFERHSVFESHLKKTWYHLSCPDSTTVEQLQRLSSSSWKDWHICVVSHDSCLRSHQRAPFTKTTNSHNLSRLLRHLVVFTSSLLFTYPFHKVQMGDRKKE